MNVDIGLRNCPIISQNIGKFKFKTHDVYTNDLAVYTNDDVQIGWIDETASKILVPLIRNKVIEICAVPKVIHSIGITKLVNSSWEEVLHGTKYKYDCKSQKLFSGKLKHTNDQFVNLTINAEDRRKVHFKIKETEYVCRVRNAYCLRVGVPPTSIVIRFGGQVISEEQRRLSLVHLGIENGGTFEFEVQKKRT